MAFIPVVDFDVYKLGTSDVADENLQELGKEIRKAFTEVGFVYLKNTGIDQKEVDRVMDISKKFFLLPEEQKRPFSRGNYANVNHVWVSLETESLNPQCPGDLTEAFNTTSLHPDIKWPSDGCDGFRDIKVGFFLRCKELSLRVLRVMALSFGLDSEFFLKEHCDIGGDYNNGATLCTLYYTPVKTESVKKDQICCGEHSDYGSITLVFQSKQEGIQVLNRKGDFISVPSIPGSVLINIADMMQRWTSDVFVSAVHRVLLPPVGDSSARQSLVFFVQPEDDVSCCDGSNRYPPAGLSPVKIQ